MNKVNIAVIGGGFFGASIALKIKEKYPNGNIDLFEKKGDLLNGTSGKNQFRSHRGYHYPRSQKTYVECEISNNSFEKFFKNCFIKSNNYYSISKYKSKTSFSNFCNYLDEVRLEYKIIKNHPLINPQLTQGILLANEKLINISKARLLLRKEIEKKDINLFLNNEVILNKKFCNDYDKIILATYESNNFLKKNLDIRTSKYFYQLVEKIIINSPKVYKDFSCVVLDGNFISIDPINKYQHVIGHVTDSVIKSKNSIEGLKLDNSDQLKYDQYLVDDKSSTLFPKIRKDFLRYFNYFEKAEYFKSFYVIRSTKKNKFDERTTEIEKNRKFISVQSGKWINCIEAAKSVSNMI